MKWLQLATLLKCLCILLASCSMLNHENDVNFFTDKCEVKLLINRYRLQMICIKIICYFCAQNAEEILKINQLITPICMEMCIDLGEECSSYMPMKTFLNYSHLTIRKTRIRWVTTWFWSHHIMCRNILHPCIPPAQWAKVCISKACVLLSCFLWGSASPHGARRQINACRIWSKLHEKQRAGTLRNTAI